MTPREKRQVMTIAALELALDETTNALRRIRDWEGCYSGEMRHSEDVEIAEKALKVRDNYMAAMAKRLKELEDDGS